VRYDIPSFWHTSLGLSIIIKLTYKVYKLHGLSKTVGNGFGRHSRGEKFAYGHGFDVNLLISDQVTDPISGSIAQSLNIVKVKKVS